MQQYEEEEIALRETLTNSELLIHWKQQYTAVYQVILNDITFIYRELSEKEYRMIEETVEEESTKEELICKMTVLEPLILDWDDEIYAGYVSALRLKILESSSLTDATVKTFERRLDMAVNSMNSFDKQLPCIIKEVFPEYEIDEILGWGRTRQIEYYAMAVWMLENLRGVVLRAQEDQF